MDPKRVEKQHLIEHVILHQKSCYRLSAELLGMLWFVLYFYTIPKSVSLPQFDFISAFYLGIDALLLRASSAKRSKLLSPSISAPTCDPRKQASNTELRRPRRESSNIIVSNVERSISPSATFLLVSEIYIRLRYSNLLYERSSRSQRSILRRMFSYTYRRGPRS